MQRMEEIFLKKQQHDLYCTWLLIESVILNFLGQFLNYVTNIAICMPKKRCQNRSRKCVDHNTIGLEFSPTKFQVKRFSVKTNFVSADQQ